LKALEQIQPALKSFRRISRRTWSWAIISSRKDAIMKRLPNLIAPERLIPKMNVYQSFGLIILQQGNYPVALAVFAEAARLNPANPLNPLMLGATYIHQASKLAGEWYALSLGWNNQPAPLQNEKMFTILQQILRIL
jgi:tetratricopeptide (TPR) repeat protein